MSTVGKVGIKRGGNERQFAGGEKLSSETSCCSVVLNEFKLKKSAVLPRRRR